MTEVEANPAVEKNNMNRIKVIVTTLAAMAAVFIFFAGTASAQMIDPRLGFGDYDEGHQWHDAGWWWQNHPDWVRQNHPTWWGDYDDGRVWRPAS